MTPEIHRAQGRHGRRDPVPGLLAGLLIAGFIVLLRERAENRTVLAAGVVLGWIGLAAVWLLRHPGFRRVPFRRLDRMDGPAFETWVASRLLASGLRVERPGPGRDYGVDLIVCEGDLRIAVQAKRRRGRVGNHAIQEVIAGADWHGCGAGLVVTQSSFTRPARLQAERSRVPVVLADRGDLPELRRVVRDAFRGLEVPDPAGRAIAASVRRTMDAASARRGGGARPRAERRARRISASPAPRVRAPRTWEESCRSAPDAMRAGTAASSRTTAGTPPRERTRP